MLKEHPPTRGDLIRMTNGFEVVEPGSLTHTGAKEPEEEFRPLVTAHFLLKPLPSSSGLSSTCPAGLAEGWESLEGMRRAQLQHEEWGRWILPVGPRTPSESPPVSRVWELRAC